MNALINRDGNRCYLCLDVITSKTDMTIDHLIPKSQGGSDDIANLRIAHGKCNNAKKDLSLEEYAVLQEGY